MQIVQNLQDKPQANEATLNTKFVNFTLSSAPTDATVEPSALMDTESTARVCASGSVCTVLPVSFSHTLIMPWLSPDTTRLSCAWLDSWG